MLALPVAGGDDGAGACAVRRLRRPAVPSASGMWVAGDAVDPRAPVISAAGAGAAAAIGTNADLVEEDIANAVEAAA